MDDVHHLFKKLFSGGEEDVGYSEEEVIAAEKRLGIGLPEPIRNFYLTQVRNRLINSCHGFDRPEHLHIDDDQWLLFYGENQGIWGSAIDLQESEDLKVYINYEQQVYEEEAKSFRDFLIVRAACDYGNYIYPYRMKADNLSPEDIAIIAGKLGEPQSEIRPPNYNFRRRLFWQNEEEVVRILEFENNVYNGNKSVFVQSFHEACFDRYAAMNEHVEWTILAQGEMKSKDWLSSTMPESESSQKLGHLADDYGKAIDGEDDDLPF